jgi:hypothetical protein
VWTRILSCDLVEAKVWYVPCFQGWLAPRSSLCLLAFAVAAVGSGGLESSDTIESRGDRRLERLKRRKAGAVTAER